MKLTWFGGATFRLHVGGQIIVAYPDGAPAEVNRVELEAGADRIIDFVDPPPAVLDWRPRAATAPINDADAPGIEVVTLPGAGLGIAAPGGSPIVIADADRGGVAGFLPSRPRWALQAIVVLHSGASSEASLRNEAEKVLAGLAPRLIVVAAGDDILNKVWGALADQLDGTGLVALERGLALEV